MIQSKRARETVPWPVLFLGHGSPMNAVRETPYSQAWRALGEKLGTPSAVLCISAHWLTQGTRITSNRNPRTIHDFGGFPEELFQVQYPAPGDPNLARRTAELLGLGKNALTEEWGLDHGAWSVLRRLYPSADVPVVQLSLDANRTEADHMALGQKLAPLRRENVLILASGNIVHNLRFLNWSDVGPVPEWAREFDQAVAHAVLENKPEKLIRWDLLTPTARQAHPSPDHFWPLLYAMGLREPSDQLTFPVEGFQNSTISMRAVSLYSS